MLHEQKKPCSCISNLQINRIKPCIALVFYTKTVKSGVWGLKVTYGTIKKVKLSEIPVTDVPVVIYFISELTTEKRVWLKNVFFKSSFKRINFSCLNDNLITFHNLKNTKKKNNLNSVFNTKCGKENCYRYERLL